MNEIPEGQHDPDSKKSGISSEDRIVLAMIGFFLLAVLVVICFLARAVFVMFGMAADGPGLKTSLLIGFAVSVCLTGFLALVAGDGLVGELGAACAMFIFTMLATTATVLLVF